MSPVSQRPPTLGLIAGEGEFPMMVARGAKRAGRRVVVVGLKNNYDAGMPSLADAFYPAGVARLGKWIRCLRREGVTEAVMAGRVRKSTPMGMSRWRLILAYLPDWTSIRLWFRASRDRRNDALLAAVADELQKHGVTLIDSTTYCSEAMASDGPMTRATLSAQLTSDLAFGLPIAQAVGRLDIGQAIIVREGDVIAVEAIEGTDAMIERAASLCPGGGWMLIKLAKPNQDMRFDVPTIGPNTIEKLVRHKAGALVVEAGKTLMVERERTIALADAARLPLIGVVSTAQTAE